MGYVSRCYALLAAMGVRESMFVILTLVGCAAARDPGDAAPTSPPQPTTAATATMPASKSGGVDGDPLPGPPRIVIENHSKADISLYAGYLVDEEGKLGTMALWPHPSDCPAHEPKERLLPNSGTYDLAPPTHAFDEARCAPGRALPPGRYLVHIDSGYGADLYAGGEITLPLTEPVRLKMEAHDATPGCTPARAQRAARLVLAAAKEAGVADSALAGCDPTRAGCGTLPLPDDDAPPRTCAMTLHESLVRVRRPPRGDAPKEITAWLDRDLVFAQRADVSRSSSAELFLGPDRVVFEGLTQHHMHEHGGDAAQIGSMRVRVFNPSKRSLLVRPTAVDWLTDHGCGTPQESSPKPAITGYQPKALPPGTTELTVQFSPRPAYQAHCDVFASRVHLEVEGRDVSVTGEHEVTRVEPLHR